MQRATGNGHAFASKQRVPSDGFNLQPSRCPQSSTPDGTSASTTTGQCISGIRCHVVARWGSVDPGLDSGWGSQSSSNLPPCFLNKSIRPSMKQHSRMPVPERDATYAYNGILVFCANHEDSQHFFTLHGLTCRVCSIKL